MIGIKRIIEIESLSIITIAAAVSMVVVVYNNHKQQQNFSATSPVVENNSANAQTLPSPSPLPQTDLSSQISPDGTKKVLMKTTHNADGTLTYIVSTSDGSGNNEQQIYTTTLSGSESMHIPFNTWSPDNRYFFIIKNDKDVMVFRATGEVFANGEAYLDASDAFNARNTGYTLQEATGWASPTLIIINTTTSSNTKGPSYWFEVPSKAIIRLSTEF